MTQAIYRASLKNKLQKPCQNVTFLDKNLFFTNKGTNFAVLTGLKISGILVKLLLIFSFVVL